MTSPELKSPGADLERTTLERIRITSGKRISEWGEILEIGSRDYCKFLEGKLRLPEKAWIAAAEWLDIDPQDLVRGELDYRNISKSMLRAEEKFPERYSIAMFGRRRTTITSLDFVEKKSGWKTRLDCLRTLGVNDTLFDDSMAPISMQFITDLCELLSARYGYRPNDFFDMGVYSAEGNRNTVLAEFYRKSRAPSEIYELMFGEMLKFYEQNCAYSLLELKDGSAVTVVSCNPHIADALRVPHLGNEHICHLKAGWMSSAMEYLGLPRAHVREVSCVHRGDAVCKFTLDFNVAVAAHARMNN